LEGIKQAGNVDLSVWLGIFIDGNDTVYERQLDAVTTAIKKYGTEHIAGITVGVRFLFCFLSCRSYYHTLTRAEHTDESRNMLTT
jgi:hypothetical protein